MKRAGEAETVEVSGIRLSTEGIMPVGGNLATLVRREDVRDVTLRYGFRSPHPLLEFLFGLVLATPGVFVVRHVSGWFIHGGTLFEAEVLFVVPALIGFSLVIDAGRRGYYLAIDRRRGRAKIAFFYRTPLVEAERFCDTMALAGYVVVRDVIR